MTLLKQVNQLIRSEGWYLGNIDSTIIAEEPKIKPHIQLIKEKLSQVLNICQNQVSIKATTNERLGPVGREKGISSYAVILLFKSL